MGENNNSYKVAFWLMTVVCGVWLVSLTTCVISTYNRLEDKNIVVLARINDLHQVSNDCLHKIDLRLSRIEYKMGVDTEDTRNNLKH